MPMKSAATNGPGNNSQTNVVVHPVTAIKKYELILRQISATRIEWHHFG